MTTSLFALSAFAGVAAVASASNPHFERVAQYSEIRSQSESNVPLRIDVPGALSIRLEFENAQLPDDAVLVLESVKDHAIQTIRTRDLFEHWSAKSAFFNGNAVDIRLLHAGPSSLSLRAIIFQTAVADDGTESPQGCGSHWTAGEDSRVGRFVRSDCFSGGSCECITGWFFSSNGYVLTNAIGAGRVEVFEINPPPSDDATGAIQHAPPSRQFNCRPVRNLLTDPFRQPGINALVVQIGANADMVEVADIFRSHFNVPPADTVDPDLTFVYTFSFGITSDPLPRSLNLAPKFDYGVLLSVASGDSLIPMLPPTTLGAQGAPIVVDPDGEAKAIGLISGGICGSPQPSCRSQAIQDAVCHYRADFNGDQLLDVFDYLDFIIAFATQGVRADFNADNIVDFFDYLDFVAAFASSC